MATHTYLRQYHSAHQQAQLAQKAVASAKAAYQANPKSAAARSALIRAQQRAQQLTSQVRGAVSAYQSYYGVGTDLPTSGHSAAGLTAYQRAAAKAQQDAVAARHAYMKQPTNMALRTAAIQAQQQQQDLQFQVSAYQRALGGTGTPAPGTTVPGAPASGTGAGLDKPPTVQMPAGTENSALQIITDALDQAGLGDLGKQAWQMFLGGTPTNEITLFIRNSDAYKQRFPGMAQLNASGQSVSEAEYLSKERADIELMRAYGLPDSMATDRQDLGNLIGNQVSTSELQSRLDMYKNIVTQLPSEYRTYMQQHFGVGAGDLIGYWINPEKAATAIQNQYQASLVGGAASAAGFGELDAQTALRLAGQGVSLSQAQSGFAKAANEQQLAQTLPGEAPDAVNRGTLVGAELDNNAAAQQALMDQAQRRKNMFAGDSGFSVSAQGVTGLGNANNG